MASMPANATASPCTAESCSLVRRGDITEATVGSADFNVIVPPYDYYCNSKDENKVCFDTGDNRKLNSGICRANCHCNPNNDGTKGSVTCISWGNCNRQTVEDICKCWGVANDKAGKAKGKEICGNAPLESYSSKTQRPAATVAAKAGKIF